MEELQTRLRKLAEAFGCLADDPDLLSELKGALKEHDAARYRKALARIPAPDYAPSFCRFVTETIGWKPGEGDLVEVCEISNPRTNPRAWAAVPDSELERIAQLPKSEQRTALWELFRRHDLLECHMEWRPGPPEKVERVWIVCGPELPASPHNVGN